MSRKRYHRNNILRMDRTERMVFNAIIDLIKMMSVIVVGIVKGTFEATLFIKKTINNAIALKKIGYRLDDILDMVYKLSPRQFEVFVAELFKQHGYSVKLTAPSNDYGRDVILNDNIFVECKHYKKENMIGREICQKLLGSIQMFNAAKGIIITTGTYHKNAHEVARMVNNLELMDITDIQRMLLELKSDQISKVIMRTLNAS